MTYGSSWFIRSGLLVLATLLLVIHRGGGAKPRVVYRIIEGRQPTLADVLSDAERGRQPVPGHQDLHDGRSVWNTEVQARKKALALPMLGGCVAALELPDDGPYRLQRTTSSTGHWTLWADSAGCPTACCAGSGRLVVGVPAPPLAVALSALPGTR